MIQSLVLNCCESQSQPVQRMQHSAFSLLHFERSLEVILEARTRYLVDNMYRQCLCNVMLKLYIIESQSKY